MLDALPIGTVSLLLALLAVVGQALVLSVWGSALLGRRWGRARELHRWLSETLAPSAIPLALVVTIAAMSGSLYFSEVANFPPCRLCWYQRIAMYPLVPALAGALVARVAARQVWQLLAPQVVIGALISIYHYQLERFPTQSHGACEIDNPCTVVWIWKFHYISIPMLALTAFALVGTLLWIASRTPTTPDGSED